MKNHKWSKEQREIVLELLYKNYKFKDESVIFELASDSIGTTIGSINGIYLSFKYLSQGIPPRKTKGGVGAMYNQEIIDVYNEFVERNNISQKELNIMFS